MAGFALSTEALTDVAAKHTEQRTSNFDICLPLWVARNNKTIFGTLFIAGGLFVLARWRTSSRGDWYTDLGVVDVRTNVASYRSQVYSGTV